MHGRDVVGQGNPESPGSDGASPYQWVSTLFPPIVLVLVLVLDFFMQAHGGVTSLGRATREAPVRTEPHPTKGLRLSFPPIVLVLVLVLVLDFFMQVHGGVTSLGGATRESPGSDGASPYQRASPLFPPIVLVLVLVLVLDFFMQVHGG